MKTELSDFTPLLDVMLEDPAIGLSGAAVYGKIWRYCQMEHKKCWASKARLADELGISPKTAQRQIAVLIREGYIRDLTPEKYNAPHELVCTDKVDILVQIGVTKCPTTKEVGQNVLPGRSKCPTEVGQNVPLVGQNVLQREYKKEEQERIEERIAPTAQKFSPTISENKEVKDGREIGDVPIPLGSGNTNPDIGSDALGSLEGSQKEVAQGAGSSEDNTGIDFCGRISGRVRGSDVHKPDMGTGSEPEDPLLMTLDRETEKAREKEVNWTVPPEAGGADPWADGPVDAFCVLADIPPLLLADDKRRDWARKLSQIGDEWSKPPDFIVMPALMVKGIKAVPKDAKIGWKTYTNPFAGNFAHDIGPLLLNGGRPRKEEAKGPTGGLTKAQQATLISRQREGIKHGAY